MPSDTSRSSHLRPLPPDDIAEQGLLVPLTYNPLHNPPPPNHPKPEPPVPLGCILILHHLAYPFAIVSILEPTGYVFSSCAIDVREFTFAAPTDGYLQAFSFTGAVHLNNSTFSIHEIIHNEACPLHHHPQRALLPQAAAIDIRPYFFTTGSPSAPRTRIVGPDLPALDAAEPSDPSDPPT